MRDPNNQIVGDNDFPSKFLQNVNGAVPNFIAVDKDLDMVQLVQLN